MKDLNLDIEKTQESPGNIILEQSSAVYNLGEKKKKILDFKIKKDNSQTLVKNQITYKNKIIRMTVNI